MAKRSPGRLEEQATICVSSQHRASLMLMLRMCPEPGRDVAWGTVKDASDRAMADVATQAPKLAVI